jgi:hypothetical protein
MIANGIRSPWASKKIERQIAADDEISKILADGAHSSN